MSSAIGPSPTWAEFDERPAAEYELRSPAAELAAVLQRFRADLDEAARAGAESRARGLCALAEQAVLAVELENVLELHRHALEDPSFESAHRALRRLKDRMLDHIAASGLEVVRLREGRAGDVAAMADVDCWRYDDIHAEPVVVEELEPAVRLDGVPLRRGRVVMGGPRDADLRAAPAQGQPQRPEHRPHERVARRGERGTERQPVPVIICPVAGCGAENEAAAEACVGCLTPLAGFGRLSMHPEALFNRGLRAARAGDSALARECFAAVVLWMPHDIRARNAHAMACLDARDGRTAGRAWREVLARAPGDRLAVRGLAALARARPTRAG